MCIELGAKAITADGKEVVRKGFRFSEGVDVPAGLIASADDDRVSLDIRSDELERHVRQLSRVRGLTIRFRRVARPL